MSLYGLLKVQNKHSILYIRDLNLIFVWFVTMAETHRGGLELLCDSKKIHNVNIEQPNGEDKVVFALKVIEMSF